jgi:hypothetical protein
MYTGTLDVVTAEGIKTYQWNGKVEDREEAEKAFNELIKTGTYLAVVHDSPSRSHQVKNFTEVIEHEKEHGTVAVQISQPLVGG